MKDLRSLHFQMILHDDVVNDVVHDESDCRHQNNETDRYLHVDCVGLQKTGKERSRSVRCKRANRSSRREHDGQDEQEHERSDFQLILARTQERTVPCLHLKHER